jgi:heme oxygenase
LILLQVHPGEAEVKRRLVETVAEVSDLSRQIKAATDVDHRRLEERMGLPESVASIEGYAAVLMMFHALADAQSHSFAADFQRYGIPPGTGRAIAAINRDLSELGASGGRSVADFPATFPHALGARYVAEGSALGNILLLRHVEAQLGERVAHATTFLRETTTAAGASFARFRAGLDAFGAAEPEARSAVIDGARIAFEACGALLAKPSA